MLVDKYIIQVSGLSSKFKYNCSNSKSNRSQNEHKNVIFATKTSVQQLKLYISITTINYTTDLVNNEASRKNN